MCIHADEEFYEELKTLTRDERLKSLAQVRKHHEQLALAANQATSRDDPRMVAWLSHLQQHRDAAARLRELRTK